MILEVSPLLLECTGVDCTDQCISVTVNEKDIKIIEKVGGLKTEHSLIFLRKKGTFF